MGYFKAALLVSGSVLFGSVMAADVIDEPISVTTFELKDVARNLTRSPMRLWAKTT